MLGVPPHKIRVIAPDLGGGFGTKASGYAEDALIPIAAVALGRPVKWIESRREHMSGAAHARHQVHAISLAATRDGSILGVRDRIWLDLGAYNVWGVVLPYNTVAHLIGPHRIKHMRVDVQAVVTNKTPNAPYRGAGRPETVFAMDRIVDCLARELRMDPAELRRRNYIRPDELPYDFGMPYRDGNPLVYDTGDFPEALEKALEAADYRTFRAEQPRWRAQGIHRGIGISGYVEGTAIGPFEGATVKLDLAGRVLVATGAINSGQGHETSFAQVAADALGVPMDWVTVIGGDTAAVPFGVGTFASRSAVTAGSSIVDACREVRTKLATRGGRAARGGAGRHRDRGRPGVRQRRAGLGGRSGACHPGVDSDLREARRGATGLRGDRVSSRADRDVCQRRPRRPGRGRRLDRPGDPAQVCRRPRLRSGHQSDHRRGQVHGGVAQGVGGALFEEMVYDETGQLLTGSLMDYAVPKADDLPLIETVHLEFPSPRNPLGVKGLGEGGAISPPAAIANAIEDALAPFGVRVTETPVTPARIVALLERARS